MEAKHIQVGKYYKVSYRNPKLQSGQFINGAKVLLDQVHESGLKGMFKIENTFREIDFIDVQNWEQEMEEQVMLGGMSFDVVKAKFDAIDKQRKELKGIILKDSVVFIAESIKTLGGLIKAIKECETKEDAEPFAKQANELCITVQRVSDLTGVKYDIPYPANEYCCGDDGDDGVFSENVFELDFFSYDDSSDELYKLSGLLQDMESSVQEWNSSYC